MSRLNLFNFSALLLSTTVGLYTGLRFFEPIVVEKLREDGNLRTDMKFPEYDDEGNPIIPEVEQIKSEISENPDLKPSEVIQNNLSQNKSKIIDQVAELEGKSETK